MDEFDKNCTTGTSSEMEWEQTFDAIPDMVALVDLDFRIRRVNRAFCNKFHISKKEATDTSCYRLVHGTDAPPSNCPHRLVLEDHREHSVVRYEEKMDGYYHFSVSPLLNDQGELISCVHVIRDVTPLKKAEEDQFAAFSTLQSVIDSISDSIMLIGTDYKVRLMNKAAHTLHDKTSNSSHFHCYKTFHHQDTPCVGEDHPCPMDMVLTTKQPAVVLHHHLIGDGKSVPVEITASPVKNSDGEIIGIIELCRDISARIKTDEQNKKLQARLFQRQKEESISALAGGIAHDFNNTLTGVLGYSELLQMTMSENNESHRYLEKIIEGANHMANLTSQVLAYAKGGKYLPRPSDINKIIINALELAHKGRASEIDVTTNFAPDLWPVNADSGQIQQLLVNLFNNSFEAMASQKKGTLTITTLNTTWKKNQDFSSQTVIAGDYVQVDISDTGLGIPQDIQVRIFEPFFSSKFIGRGLGLSAAYGIASNHGGHLFLAESNTNKTLFTLLIPRGIDTEAVPGLEDTTAVAPHKILIVDDNIEILDIAGELLRSSGFDILTSDNGRDALKTIEKEPNIDLVLLDVMMPAMSGIEVYNQIKASSAKVKVLITSGYDQETALEGLTMLPGDKFISKPFHLKSLLEKIREMLNGKSEIHS